eukprot:COSAG06_NODE_2028_length_7800_cov_5036.112972_5_plen_177_part_00
MFAVDNYGEGEDVIKFIAQGTQLEWWSISDSGSSRCDGRCFDYGVRKNEENLASIACVFDPTSESYDAAKVCDCAFDGKDEDLALGAMPWWGGGVCLVVSLGFGWCLTELFEKPVGKRMRYKEQQQQEQEQEQGQGPGQGAAGAAAGNNYAAAAAAAAAGAAAGGAAAAAAAAAGP